MIYFNSDYLEGAHPALMAKLNETNMVQTVGYGEDEYCAAARVKIQNACQAPEADVHFLVGGTQTNTTVIAAVLVGTLVGVLNRAFGKRRDTVMGREAKRIQHTAGYQQKTGLQVEL